MKKLKTKQIGNGIEFETPIKYYSAVFTCLRLGGKSMFVHNTLGYPMKATNCL